MKENVFTRNPNGKIAALMICAVIFSVTYFLCNTLFPNTYVYEWMARNHYGYAWVFPLIMIIFDKNIIACCSFGGFLAGMGIGQKLGDFLKAEGLKKVTPDMDPGRIEYLTDHKGVFICAAAGLIGTGIGIAITVILYIRRRRVNKLSTA